MFSGESGKNFLAGDGNEKKRKVIVKMVKGENEKKEMTRITQIS